MERDEMMQHIEFLRYSLNPETELSLDSANIDWEGLYHFASEQAILGVVFEGVKRLKEKGVKLPIKQFVTWIAAADDIAEQNKKINQAVLRLTTKLKEKGQQTCILKGQGNNLLYPNVYARTPGDIDVWVKHEGISEKEYIGKVIQYVKRKNHRGRVTYHHIEIGKIDGIDVELHIRPSFMNSPIHNHRLQKWFNEQAAAQFGHEIEGLPDCTEKICVPTTYFNIVFLLSHIYRHLLKEGIGLRQVIDYFFLLQKAKDEWKIENGELRIMLRYLGLWKIAGAMMWVLKEVLGMEEKYLIVPPNEKLGVFLLEEIMQGGNFGRYDVRTKHSESAVSRNIERLQRDVRLVWYFPSECLWEPLFRIYHFFWRLPYL